MTIGEVYLSLPTLEQYPQFYVPGYTESLKTYTGVRVVPDQSFVEGVASPHRMYLTHMQYPYYFIPVRKGNNCYGYVLKSQEKRTPRLVSNFFLPGYEDVQDNSIVCCAEGFKDTYLLRAAGIPCFPMLTAILTESLLSDLVARHIHLLFIPDNDSHRDHTKQQLEKKAKSVKLSYSVYDLSMVKDLGDFFLPELRSAALQEAHNIIHWYKENNPVWQSTTMKS